MYERSVLPNGLRVLTAPMPHSRSVTVSFYFGAGSRYEEKRVAGLSHFLEHLCFKGSRKRPTAREIAEAVDGVGGSLNGGTDREYTTYYCKVARPHFPLALDVLVDMVRCPILAPEEVEKERKVILEELAMVADSPQQQADVLLDSLLWPDQPLGWDVAGTPESVAALEVNGLRSYLRRQYVPNNAVVSVAGDLSHAEVVEAVTAASEGWEPGAPESWFPALDGPPAPRVGLLAKRTEQAHLAMAVRALPSHHPDRYALSLLSIILGEGMSSRLFLELRERRGLAYDVHSYVNAFLDTGAFMVYAGVDPGNGPEALEAILRELAPLREGVPEAELHKAKELSKGRLLLRLEDTRSVAGWVGGQEILWGHVHTPEEVVAALEAVTAADVRRLAEHLFVNDGLCLAVVGPYRSERRFRSRLSL